MVTPMVLLILAAAPGSAASKGHAVADGGETSAGVILFAAGGVQDELLPAKDQWELRSRIARVHRKGFAQVCSRTETPAQLVYNLFKDLEVTAVTTASRVDENGLLEWRGKVAGSDNEQVVLTARNACDGAGKPLVSAELTLRHHRITIQPVRPGLVRVVELDPSVPFTEPPLEPVAVQQSGATRARQSPAGPLAAVALQPSATCTGTGTTMDLMALYTPEARSYLGGEAAIEMAIANAVTWTNQAYANSGIGARMRLVHTQEATGYSGGEEVTEALLHDLANSAGPGLQDVHDLRDQHGADLVTLVTISPSGDYVLGIGYTPSEPSPATEPYGYSVTSIRYKFPMILAHETGHNVGANHDWLTTPVRNDLHPYNHGYVPPSKAWHTIMAYNSACDGCNEAPLYSSPNRSYQGEVAGVADAPGVEQPADNARMLSEFAPVIEAYRAAVTPSVLCSLTTEVSPTGGGTATPEIPGPYAPDVSVTVTAVPKAGYEFTGWTLDGQPYGGGATTVSVRMDSDHNLTATFAPTLPIPLIDPWCLVLALPLAAMAARHHTRTRLA